MQEEMRRKKELEKVRSIKDKRVRDKMLESIESEEEARRLHEQELRNQGKTPDEGEAEPTLEPGEKEVTKGVPEAALPRERAEGEEDLGALQDLAEAEEAKIEEAHEQGAPHVHKGLPYEPEEEEDRLMRKFESLHLSKQGPEKVDGIEKGMRVYGPTMRPGAPEEMKEGEVVALLDNRLVQIRWDDGGVTTRYPDTVFPMQRRLFAKDKFPRFREGDRVSHVWDMALDKNMGTVGKQEIGGKWRGFVEVEWDEPGDAPPGHNIGGRSVYNPLNLRREQYQRGLFAAKAADLAPGDPVWFSSDPKKRGKVLVVRVNKSHPERSIATVDWSEVGLGVHDIPLNRLTTRQRRLWDRPEAD
jgi:hypothetical protein